MVLDILINNGEGTVILFIFLLVGYKGASQSNKSRGVLIGRPHRVNVRLKRCTSTSSQVKSHV